MAREVSLEGTESNVTESAPTIQVEVLTLTPIETGKVLAKVDLSLQCGPLSVVCGPWRVLPKPEGGLSVWAPDLLVGPNEWRPTITVPPEVHQQIVATVTSALEAAREGGEV